MKTIRLLVLATAFLLGLTGPVAARVVRNWSYQELLAKSDLVAIATPAATNETKEHTDFPGFAGEPVLGVETRFKVCAVLKGDNSLKEFVLHHYRSTEGGKIAHLPNGPTFISFDPVVNPTLPPRTFILFLFREADARYAPIVGQIDPGEAIKELK